MTNKTKNTSTITDIAMGFVTILTIVTFILVLFSQKKLDYTTSHIDRIDKTLVELEKKVNHIKNNPVVTYTMDSEGSVVVGKVISKNKVDDKFVVMVDNNYFTVSEEQFNQIEVGAQVILEVKADD